MNIKRLSILALLLALCLILPLYYGCDEDDNGAGPEPTATPTNTPTPAGPTNTPTPAPTGTAHPINGCWDFEGSLQNCAGEPQTTCDLLCGIYPSIDGQMQFEKREGNVVHIWLQALGGDPVEVDATLEGNTLSFTGIFDIEPFTGVSVHVELTITATLGEGTLTGTMTAHATGNFQGEFDCTAAGAFSANKKSPDPCTWE